jgi:hypothetical protein
LMMLPEGACQSSNAIVPVLYSRPEPASKD